MADIEINKSDIDEVNDVIQETDEEAYALDSEFTEEKEYKTVQKYELVTILSYLIGVRNEILDHMCSDEYVELLNSLRENKNARILRYLCKARTGLLRNYKKTDNEIKYNLGNINRMEWFDSENINKLESWEVHIILYNSSADKYCVHINKLINEHVDAVEDTKENIYEFIRESMRVVIVVDCENSDVYKLYGVLKNLNSEQMSKIEKIILYDDYHTSCGWDWLEKFIHIPVFHEEVERVTDRKSLVDIKMTAGVCEAYYKDNIDSFILCSSDSDYWGLISSVKDAHFLVMYEYSKCGQSIKDALTKRCIFHCSIDDFYTGNASDLKKKVMINELKNLTNDIVGKNGWEMTRQIYERTKITSTEREMKDFYNKYVKSLRLKINEDGVFEIVVNEY